MPEGLLDGLFLLGIVSSDFQISDSCSVIHYLFFALYEDDSTNFAINSMHGYACTIILTCPQVQFMN